MAQATPEDWTEGRAQERLALLQLVGIDAVVIDPDQRVLAMTEASGASAGLPRPLALHNRTLTVRRTADQRRFNMALKKMLRADVGGRTIVPIGNEHFLTMIRDVIDEHPVIVVIIADRSRDGQVSPQCLQQAFDLTAREAELATILATGEPLQKAAARLQMSLPTARTHLRHIYQKTSVQTQSGLVALIAACTFGRCMPQPPAQRLFVLLPIIQTLLTQTGSYIINLT